MTLKLEGGATQQTGQAIRPPCDGLYGSPPHLELYSPSVVVTDSFAPLRTTTTPHSLTTVDMHVGSHSGQQ